MKTKLLFIAIAAIGLSSCSIAEDSSAPLDQQLASINFANGRVLGSTKAIDKTTTWTGGEEVGIFAMKTTGSIASNAFSADFAKNIKLDNNQSKLTASWTPESALYWPANADDRITFFAYHPYAATAPAIAAGSISIQHTVKPDPALQTDLLWAWVTDAHKGDMDGTGTAPTPSSVPFVFRHALTKISFSGSTDMPSDVATIKITALTITANSIRTAKTSIDATRNLTWDDSKASVPVAFEVVGTEGPSASFIVNTSGAIGDFGSENHELLMVPQDHAVGNKINLSYTIAYKTGFLDHGTAEYTLDEAWAPNAHIKYNFNINPDEILFTFIPVGWDDEGL